MTSFIFDGSCHTDRQISRATGITETRGLCTELRCVIVEDTPDSYPKLIEGIRAQNQNAPEKSIHVEDHADAQFHWSRITLRAELAKQAFSALQVIFDGGCHTEPWISRATGITETQGLCRNLHQYNCENVSTSALQTNRGNSSTGPECAPEKYLCPRPVGRPIPLIRNYSSSRTSKAFSALQVICDL